jgi:hypothetical protein
MNDIEVVNVDEAERISAVAVIEAGQAFTNFKDAMWACECAIRKGDDDALRARWESGRLMLASRRGKRLDNGVLARYASALKTSTSELTSRQKFAEKYPERCPTQPELLMYVRSRRPAAWNGDRLPSKAHIVTWNEIRTTLLTDTPRGKKEPNASALLKDALNAIQRVTYVHLTAEDLEVVAKIDGLLDVIRQNRDDEAAHEAGVVAVAAYRARTGADLCEGASAF